MPPDTGIRLIERGDAEALAAHRTRDAERLAPWEPARAPGFDTVDGQQAHIGALLADHAVGARWPAVVLAGDDVIGQITLSTIIRGPFQKGFLGYWIASTAEGKGHATRAVGRMLTVATEELGLRRVEAHCQLDNLASQHVLRANGFAPWGVAHAHIFIQGTWRDELFWERTL